MDFNNKIENTKSYRMFQINEKINQWYSKGSNILHPSMSSQFIIEIISLDNFQDNLLNIYFFYSTQPADNTF